MSVYWLPCLCRVVERSAQETRAQAASERPSVRDKEARSPGVCGCPWPAPSLPTVIGAAFQGVVASVAEIELGSNRSDSGVAPSGGANLPRRPRPAPGSGRGSPACRLAR